MGRQHTTWISEENWKKLENIPGDSVSSKIGKAISMADPDTQMYYNAKLRQLDAVIIALQEIELLIQEGNANKIPGVIESHSYLWYRGV